MTESVKLTFRTTQFFDSIINADLKYLKRVKNVVAAGRLKELLKMRYDGKTPLLIAAQNNSCELVEFLICECSADPEEVGKVVIDNENIDDASALWCSAAVGCLRCVKILLEHGANVNTTTSTNSTPLRAACFDGHFDIVEYLIANNADIELANQQGHTCLMIACYKKHHRIARYLIENGAQVNRQSLKGHSALHDCVDSDDSLEIIQLLLDNGAKFFKDFSGLTPLMTAALAGNSFIVEFFLDYSKSSLEISNYDREDAFRLLGATAVDKNNDLQLALRYWEKALEVRDPERPTFQQSLNLGDDDVQRQFYNVGFSNSYEFETLDDLEAIRYDPMKTRMHALLIRERIVGVDHPDTSFFVRSRGVNLVFMNHESQCFSLWMYMLKQQHDTCKPLSLVTLNSYVSLIELISHMLRDDDLRAELKMCDIFRIWKLASEELLNYIEIMPKHDARNSSENCSNIFQIHSNKSDDVADFIRDGVKFNGDSNPLDRQFLICIQLMGFMCENKHKMCSKMYHEFRRSVYHFVRRNPRSSCLSTVLHIMCFIRWSDLCMPPNLRLFLDIFNLIVEMSPDLNEIDSAGNTALHFLFRDRYFKNTWINLLLERGAHLDVCNQAGRTPMDYLPEGETRWDKHNLLTLMCLCAQKISKMILSQSSKTKREQTLQVLPNDLRRFVELHMPRSLTAYPNEDN